MVFPDKGSRKLLDRGEKAAHAEQRRADSGAETYFRSISFSSVIPQLSQS
jgi:hypothetical protein